MDSLKDLTDFLKTRDNGASFSDLRDVFQNEDEIKHFVKVGLENEVIFSTGQRRGMRYYAKGKTPAQPSAPTAAPVKNKEKKDKKERQPKEVENFGTDLEVNNDINIYLQSDKPIPGQGVFTEVSKFGEPDSKNIIKFLSSGMLVKTYYIEYDKYQKRNVVVQVIEDKMYNKIGLKYEDGKFMLEKVYAHNAENATETFKDYEEFRELLRSMIL